MPVGTSELPGGRTGNSGVRLRPTAGALTLIHGICLHSSAADRAEIPPSSSGNEIACVDCEVEADPHPRLRRALSSAYSDRAGRRSGRAQKDRPSAYRCRR